MSHERYQIHWSEWIPFIRESIANVPHETGVYILANSQSQLYIGQDIDLCRRLDEHLNEDNDCIKKTTHFRFAITEDAGRLEVTLLNQFRINNDGKLPPCNSFLDDEFYR